MDFAFNQAGTLWAVGGASDLWTIDTATGVGTHITNITGTDGPVMGIMFDTDGTLHATDYTPSSNLYRIDTTTGAATLVGNTGLAFSHGGDIALNGSIPEPSSVISAGIAGLVGVAVARRRRRASAVVA